MSTPVYVVRNDEYGRRYIRGDLDRDLSGISYKFKDAKKYTSLEEAQEEASRCEGRNVYRVSYVLRWHNEDGTVYAEGARYRPDCGGCSPRSEAQRFDSAEQARSAPAPMMFERDAEHLRVVRVLTKVR